VLLSRLLMILLIPSVVTLSACSGSGSGSSGTTQQNNNDSTDSGDNSDGGNSDNDGSNGSDNGSGSDNSGGGGSDGDGSDGGDNSGGGFDGDNSGIEGGCVYAEDDYQQPEDYALREYLDISLNLDTYTIRDGQEATTADTDLTGTWLAVHNVTRQSTSSLNQHISDSHYRMVFVIRDNGGQLEYAQCTAATNDSNNLLAAFVSLEDSEVGDTITLPLNEITASAQFTISSNTRMDGVAINAASENSIRERVEYHDQLTQAVKISDSTHALGTLSLSAFGLATDHANKGVYCVTQALSRESQTECKNPTPQRASNSFLTVRAEDKVRISTGFQASSSSNSELMLFRYDQDNGERYDNTILELQTNLPNNGMPDSQFNLNISKSSLTGSMAISGIPQKNPDETGTASVSMDITIPLAIP